MLKPNLKSIDIWDIFLEMTIEKVYIQKLQHANPIFTRHILSEN